MFRRPTPTSERSDEERARAAAERAARRAEREGRPPPPETFAAQSEPPPLREPEREDVHAYSPDDPFAGGYAPPEEEDAEPVAPPDPPPTEAFVAEPPVAEPIAEDPPTPEPVAEDPPTPEPVAEDPPTPEPVAEEPARGETVAFSPLDHVDAVSPPEPEREPPLAVTPPAEEHEPTTAGEPAPEAHEPPAYDPVADDPVTQPTQVHAAPDPLPPIGHTDDWVAPPAAPLPPPTPAGPPPRAANAPQRGHRWRRDRKETALAPTGPLATAHRGHGTRRILAVLALVAIAIALYVIYATFQPFRSGDGQGAVRVTVPAGADADRIGDILAARDVVDSSRFFALNATLTRRRGDLKPGRYTLPREMSNGAAIDALIQGPKAKVVKTYDLTIPEGRSARETAGRLEETSIDGDYLRASRSPANLRRARELGLPKAAKTLEGYLFPATYTLPEGTTASELVGRQLAGFADNTAKVSYRRAARKNLSRYDVLIIASMIEREVQIDRERPLVAAVIYNRLEQGIPLGIDATIRYATNNWTRPIRQSELEKDGPFNSRTRRGLPPTPIGNPGLASIRAAARPSSSDVLYYVVKPGSKGAHAFSRTDAEFQRDVERYNAAREANGGQAP